MVDLPPGKTWKGDTSSERACECECECECGRVSARASVGAFVRAKRGIVGVVGWRVWRPHLDSSLT